MTDTMDAGTTESNLFFTPPSTPEPSEADTQPEPTEAADTPEGAPEAGEGEAEAEVTQQPRLDLSELGQHMVPVKVNGEEFEVPLEEAVKGYMRQDAFTRKTQAVAEQAKRLQHVSALADQLDRDPQGLIQRLAEHFEVKLPGSEDYEEPDPAQQRLSAIEERLHQEELDRIGAQIDNEIKELQAQDPDIDIDELVAFTSDRPGLTLTDAYRIMNFDRVSSKKQTTDQITEQKRQAQVVTGAASPQKGSITKTREFKNAREAIVDALRREGVAV